MKTTYGTEILFSYLSKSEEGDCIMIKNATASGTWWKKAEKLNRKNLYSTPEAAYNDLARRFNDSTFCELYQKDYFFPVMFTIYPDSLTVGRPECFGGETIYSLTGARKYKHMVFPAGKIDPLKINKAV